MSSKIGGRQRRYTCAGSDEVMCITQKGILIRTKIKEIYALRAQPKALRIINLESGDKLST
jgi:DNA gyrase/topoisomerase IV subunit A